jgi:hypothetical protein
MITKEFNGHEQLASFSQCFSSMTGCPFVAGSVLDAIMAFGRQSRRDSAAGPRVAMFTEKDPEPSVSPRLPVSTYANARDTSIQRHGLNQPHSNDEGAL